MAQSSKPCRAKVVHLLHEGTAHTHPVIITDKPQDIRVWCAKTKKSYPVHLNPL